MRINGFDIEPQTQYPVDDTSRMVKRKASTLAADRSKGRGIPYTKVGRNIYYRGADIIAFVEAGRVAFTSAAAEARRCRATETGARPT